MPSFVCDVCQETLKKAKLEAHFSRCPRAKFSCIDCCRSFDSKDNEWKKHYTCISEAEKYQKSVYKAPKKNGVPSAERVKTLEPSALPSATQVLLCLHAKSR